MEAELCGRLVDKRTIVLDRSLKTGERVIVVRLKDDRIVKTKIDVPEEIVLEIAEKDIEELS